LERQYSFLKGFLKNIQENFRYVWFVYINSGKIINNSGKIVRRIVNLSGIVLQF